MHGEVCEECFDLWFGHRVGVADTVKANEAFGPIDVSPFGFECIVLDASGMAYAIEEFHGRPRIGCSE